MGFHYALGFNSNMGFTKHKIVHTIVLLCESLDIMILHKTNGFETITNYMHI